MPVEIKLEAIVEDASGLIRGKLSGFQQLHWHVVIKNYKNKNYDVLS